MTDLWLKSPKALEHLAAISPDMRLTQDFFKKIYGFELSFHGYAETALTTLEAAGCHNARKYYKQWTESYESEQKKVLHNTAIWLGQQYDKHIKNEQKEGTESRRTQQTKLRSLSTQELEQLYNKLLKQGTITTPNQFAELIISLQ